MVVDSAMDAYGIAMGFYIYNVLFEIFSQLGLIYLAMIILVVKETTRCMESSMEDMNTKSALKTVGIGFFSMLLVLQIGVFPTLQLKFEDVKYYSRSCTTDSDQGGVITAEILGKETQFVAGAMAVQLGGRDIRIPAAYYASMIVASGIKNWAVQDLPCSTDIRLISESVLNQVIDNPILREETSNFVSLCFDKARTKYMDKYGSDLKDEDNWPGNRNFVQGLGYYDNAEGDGFYSRTAIEGFGGTTNKLPESEGLPDNFGFPTCKEWWLGVGVSSQPYVANEGLSTRLYSELDEWLKENDKSIYDTVTTQLNRVKNRNYQYLAIKDAVVRESFFSPVKLTQLSSMSTTDYGLQGDSSATDFIFRGLGTLGVAEKSIDYFAGGSMIQLAMPMVKPFLLMGIVISLVPAMVFGGFKWKYLGLFCGLIGSIMFWPFFWELARLIDDTFLTSMGVSLAEVNTQVISQWIISALYLYLPVVFSLVLSAVGFIGADSAMTKMASPAGSAGQNATSAAKKFGGGAKKAVPNAKGGA
ncbi:conjugal transfer protein TraG N-terminal domain-containing protein [Vibrio ostreicida]|uniref:conjugal transfer protein TraG N-terminal domain-containing protein n=1 Tax=Vibrio ostreicida TaxID=526588 RepID=UPI003B5963C6